MFIIETKKTPKQIALSIKKPIEIEPVCGWCLNCLRGCAVLIDCLKEGVVCGSTGVASVGESFMIQLVCSVVMMCRIHRAKSASGGKEFQMSDYPRLVVRCHHLQHNAQTVAALAAEQGVQVTGVIKGANGLPEVAEAFVRGGLTSLGSSRLPQLAMVKERCPEIHTVALRVPMLSELEQLLACADCSLHSELATLQALAELCARKKQQHEVLLMVDLGDLREGFFDERELLAAAHFVAETSELVLKGIGTNLGCYGSIEPDSHNLGQLVALAQKVRSLTNQEVPWVSGGATTSMPLLLRHTMPAGITHLRIGDGILLRDMEPYFDYTFDALYGDCFTLEAQVVEVKDKPSYPIGTITVDAFGNRPTYHDEGVRTRALLAVGRQDAGDLLKLQPLRSGVRVLGGSSDHTIVDVTDCVPPVRVGEVLAFHMEYENVLYLTGSNDVYLDYQYN